MRNTFTEGLSRSSLHDYPCHSRTHNFRDGLSDITGRHPDLGPSDPGSGHARLEIAQESGLDVSLSLIRSHPAGSITYVVLGPLTNFAALVREDEALIASKVGRVVCMGGALDVPGNTSPVAECKSD